MEKINEIERWIWCYVATAKKKNRNVVSKRSSNQSMWIENLIKKELSWGYEADSKLIKIIKVKFIKINALKQKKISLISPIK